MSNELSKCYICDKEFDQLEIHFLRLHAFEEGLVEDANEKENITGKNLRPEIKKLHTIEDNNKIVQESKNLTVHKNIHEGENKSYNSDILPGSRYNCFNFLIFFADEVWPMPKESFQLNVVL